VRLLNSANAPNDTSLRMAGMFSKLTALQDQLMHIGAQRLARMDELGIDKQLLLPPSSGSFCRPYRVCAAGCQGRGALAGFPHEVWMHTMGLIMSGAFDRFPLLRLVIGHMGESMPLQLYRFDWMQSNADGREGLRGGAPAVKLRHKISHYFKHNIWITTRGQGWEPSIKFCMDVLGPDRVIYAMDYPYQQSAHELAAYDGFDMSVEHKKMLMQTNAERVFRLKS
jgi:predicted TIM-barrel fold metal-dependent hydrolase